jgi:hypothetical protein
VIGVIIYLHILYHLHFIFEGVAKVSQTFLRDIPIFYQNDLALSNNEDVACGKPIAV